MYFKIFGFEEPEEDRKLFMGINKEKNENLKQK